jgi:pSer/pThr/pTyr-binding forkhead associated (FHA) protein
MAKVILSLDGNVLGEFPLNQDRVTIGRRPSNTIQIDNLAVSGEHAVIITIGKDSIVEDLKSTNGTLLNKKSVKRHVLYHNDVMEFGRYELRYMNNQQLGRVVTKVELDASLKANKSQSTTTNMLDAPKEAIIAAKYKGLSVPTVQDPVDTLTGHSEKQGRLDILSGSNSGRQLPLVKAMTTLGKPGGQLAVITKRDAGYFISHVSGDKQPLVNAMPISTQSHLLNSGDEIDLAGIKMQFFID